MSTPSAPRPKRLRRIVLLVLVALAAVLAQPAIMHVRAALLLWRFEDGAPPTGLRGLGAHALDEADVTFVARGASALAATTSPTISVKARLYEPEGVTDPPGLVLLHGVHHLGIEEPRLVRFARAIASSGVAVLTPELRDLADYRVDESSIAVIEAAAHELRGRTAPKRTVGLMGTSFAGGLALLAAADPTAPLDVDYVVSLGAHDDLSRVSRFFATDSIARPDGTTLSLHAHEYGPLVFVYAHAPAFFAPEDVEAARDCIRSWLWEERDAARAKAEHLSPAARERVGELFDHHLESIMPELLHAIDESGRDLAIVSPHGHIGGMRVPVYLLHGEGDSVIPPSETLWLAHDLPAGVVKEALVTRAIGHVELGDDATLRERWAVVHFMAEVLGEMSNTRHP